MNFRNMKNLENIFDFKTAATCNEAFRDWILINEGVNYRGYSNPYGYCSIIDTKAEHGDESIAKEFFFVDFVSMAEMLK